MESEPKMLTLGGLAPTSAVSTWIGATTAVLALASYLDAKLGLSSDIKYLMSRRAAFAELKKAGNQIPSPFLPST